MQHAPRIKSGEPPSVFQNRPPRPALSFLPPPYPAFKTQNMSYKNDLQLPLEDYTRYGRQMVLDGIGLSGVVYRSPWTWHCTSANAAFWIQGR